MNNFITVCINPNANRVPATKGLLVEAQMLETGSAKPNKIVRVTDISQVGALFGEGSIIAESLRIARNQASNIGLFALPRLDDKDGVSAEYKLTIDGTAVQGGLIKIFWGCADYSIDLPVLKSSSSKSIVSRIVQSLPSYFPFLVSIENDSTIHFIAKNKGRVGNILNLKIEWDIFDSSAPVGVYADFEQTVIGQNDPKYDDYDDIIGECSYYTYALCSPSELWQLNLQKYLESGWDCDNGSTKGGHGYTYNEGKLGIILALSTNTPVLSRIAHHERDEVAGYLETAAYAALSCHQGIINPTVAVEGKFNGVLTALKYPSSCKSLWTKAEKENLKSNGFVIIDPIATGEGSLVPLMVVNDITNYLRDDNGYLNFTYRSVAMRRILQYIIEYLTDNLERFEGVPLYLKNTTITAGSVGTTINMLRSEIINILSDLEGIYLSKPDNIEDSVRIQTGDFDSNNCSIGSGVVSVFISIYPPTTLNKLNLNIQPVINNCERA